MKKMKRKEKKQRTTLILSHVNITFSLIKPPIGPYASIHTHCTL
jgi:hypothetical protein